MIPSSDQVNDKYRIIQNTGGNKEYIYLIINKKMNGKDIKQEHGVVVIVICCKWRGENTILKFSSEFFPKNLVEYRVLYTFV